MQSSPDRETGRQIVLSSRPQDHGERRARNQSFRRKPHYVRTHNHGEVSRQ